MRYFINMVKDLILVFILSLIALNVDATEVIIMDYDDVTGEDIVVYEIEPKKYKELGIRWHGPEGIELDANGDEIGQDSELEIARKEIQYLRYQVNQLQNYNCGSFGF